MSGQDNNKQNEKTVPVSKETVYSIEEPSVATGEIKTASTKAGQTPVEIMSMAGNDSLGDHTVVNSVTINNTNVSFSKLETAADDQAQKMMDLMNLPTAPAEYTQFTVDYQSGGKDIRATIKDKDIQNAFNTAMQKALEDGNFSEKEANQLKNAQELLVGSLKDGKINVEEKQNIISAYQGEAKGNSR